MKKLLSKHQKKTEKQINTDLQQLEHSVIKLWKWPNQMTHGSSLERMKNGKPLPTNKDQNWLEYPNTKKDKFDLIVFGDSITKYFNPEKMIKY